MKIESRDLLKLTTVGATGVTMFSGKRALAAWPASGTVEINPVTVYTAAWIRSAIA